MSSKHLIKLKNPAFENASLFYVYKKTIESLAELQQSKLDEVKNQQN
jgi:hypothetical protein